METLMTFDSVISCFFFNCFIYLFFTVESFVRVHLSVF